MGVGRYALLFLLMVSIVSAADASLFDTAVDSVTTFFDWVMGGITGLAIDDGSVSTASACGYVNGDITLTNNLFSNSTCLTVNASNIVIDCNGHSIVGNYSLNGETNHNGIRVFPHSNLSIRNCNISNFGRGIISTGGTPPENVSFSNNTFYDNRKGIDLTRGDNITVRSNLFVRNLWGFSQIYGDNVVVSNNTFFNHTNDAIAFTYVGNVNVHNNSINMSLYGVEFDKTNGSITQNDIFNSNKGINLRFDVEATIASNNISANTGGVDGGSSIMHAYNNYFNNSNYDVSNSNLSSTFNTTNTTGPNIIGGSYLGGNYYASYGGIDSDDDGIGDTPFNDSGRMAVPDYLPLMYPTISCGYVNSDLTLTNNISSSGTCFTVNTSNVVIDCNGYSITGSGTGFGVHSPGYGNVTVQNCVISNYTKATFLTGGSGHTVRDNTLFELDRGVDIVGFDSHVVVNNSIFNTTDYAVYLTSSNSDVVNNTVYNNTGYGVGLVTSNTILVDGNEFVNNREGGVYLRDSLNTVTTNNVFTDNMRRGIHVYTETSHTITGNNITGSIQGLHIETGAVVYNNYFDNTIDINTTQLMGQYNTTKTPDINIIGGPYLGGNFYASYAGVDADGDGIGDTPFNNSGNMSIPDYLPLMYGGSAPAFSCGYVNSDLTLTNNISSSGTCFTANASNIVIDCNGYSIAGDGTGYGIFTNSFSNVTVRNCQISHFANAVQAFTGGRTYIINNTLHSSTAGAAVQLAYATIVNNTMYNVTYGVNTNMAYSSNTTKNTVYNTTTAVYFMNTDDSVISDNIIYNSTDGIYLNLYSNNNTVYANTVLNNSGSGIRLQSSSNSGVYNNTLTANAYGVYALLTAVNSSIYGNTIVNHTHIGVWIFNSDDNTFYNNILVNNTDGVYLRNAANISIYGNTITNHSNNGLYLDTCQDCTVSNNTLNDNLVGVYERLSGEAYYYNNTISGSTAMNLSQSTNSYIYYSNLTADLYGVELDGENITVEQNTITNSNVAILSTAANVTVHNNTLSDNDVGLSVDAYGYNNITLNNMSGNVIGINSTSILHVYNNYFNNTLDINNSNASSTFNTTQTAGMNIIGGSYIGGNFYASYAGVDADGDGLGDTPFNDSGNMAVPDYLPLVYGGTPAFSCGYVNSDLTLTNNINSSGTCLTVNASNIVIDCNGYNITGDGTGDGVYSRYYDNVTIRNCVIEDFASGIDVRDGVNVSILNNTVVNSSSQALYTSMIDNVIVASNNFLLETVYIKNTNGTVEYNVFNNSDVTLSTSDINFSFNNVSDNVWGLTVLSADSVRIFNNTFRDNSFSAIKLSQIQNDRAFVYDNYFDQNSYGVYLDRINASQISNNTFVNFNPYAVYCTPLSSAYNLANEIRGNIIANSTNQGIHVSGCNDTIIIGNTITNTSVGINASVKKIVVYDNYFNNTVDISNTNSSSQFNTTKTPGINIIGGPYIGGNFYASYAGVDSDSDGIGDTPFNDSGNMAIPDFLPLMYGGSAPAFSCGYVNSDLTLTNNLSSSGTCLTVNASNIVIDCNGYSITGVGTGDGVLSNYANVTVQNCVITNFSTAVDVSHTTGNLITNNNLSHSAHYGVSGTNVTGMRLVGNSVFNSTRAGLYLDELTNIEITDNMLTNNTDGMEVRYPLINIVIENNTVYNNLEDGVRVDGGVFEYCDNVTVTGNVVYNNTFHGINVLDCDGSGNEISSNLVRDNVQHGVYLDNSPYNFSVTSNTIVRNGYYGLSMVDSADNQVINNSIRNNTQGGIYTTDVDNIIIGNTVVDHIIGINLTAEPAVVYNNYLNNTLDIFNTNVNSQFNTTQTAGMNIIGGPYIGGNYYASYNGTDTDGDGFGETPYNASGNMSVNDFLPLVPGAVYVPPTPSSGSSSSSGGGGGGGRSSSSSGSSGPVLTYLGDSSGSTTDSSTVDTSTTESSGLDTSTSETSRSETSTESSTGRSDDSSESSRTESTDTSIDRYAAPSIVTASLNAVRGMMAPVISTMKTNSILFQLVGAVALFSSILGIAHVVTRPTPVAVPAAKQVELQTVPVFIGETYMLSHETRLRKGEGEDVYVDYDIILDVHDHEHIYRRRFK